MTDEPSLDLAVGRRTPSDEPELVLVAIPGRTVPTPPTALRFSGLTRFLLSRNPTAQDAKVLAERFGWLGTPTPYAVIEGYPAQTLGEPVTRWTQTLAALKLRAEEWQAIRSAYVSQPRGADAYEGFRQQIADQLDGLRMQHPTQIRLDMSGWKPVPTTLAESLWIALGTVVIRKSEFRPCEACGTLLEVGPFAHSKNRVTCSDACKMRRHRAVHCYVPGTVVPPS